MASSSSSSPSGGEAAAKAACASSGEVFLRADEIQLESLDLEVEKQALAKALLLRKQQAAAGGGELRGRPMEPWEIDLAKLEIKEQVKQGQFGTVFRGTYDDRDVAIKLMDFGEDGVATENEIASRRALFKTEVAVWKQLDHPNVAQFVGASMGTIDLKIPADGGESGDLADLPLGACCVVVEYLDGGSLKTHLIKHMKNKLAYKVVVQLALDLARGLNYLHSNKIVHRDVKTDNMLFDAEGNLKIIDFGVARIEADNPKDMTGTTGTPGYMAPEVIEGNPYNRKCDVYSFGICLWEIYCCDRPYADMSYTEATSAIVHQDLRPEIPRCCPRKMAHIMRRCWDANPAKRPHMEEVVRLLEGLNTSKGGGMIPEEEQSPAPGCLCFFNPRRGAVD